MKHVAIGVHVHASPDQLHRTMAAVKDNSPPDVELMLLPDGPDPPTRKALAAYSDSAQYPTIEPRGAAACFNRLGRETSAEIVVLLESGSIPGPGWLHYILAAIERDQRHGLAGPSTNRSWNEQGLFPASRDTTDDIVRNARETAARFGSATRTLEPLYSLSDFCYAVRREVIDSIGEADEGYGLGPCWEMDYNIRAARAGFRGVWACAAYVHRLPFTERRLREEAARFEASKRRYQDKFCGARLRGIKNDYRAHCRGDACPNFAPATLIGRQDSPSARTLNDSRPLVTCIMPTFNRRMFIPQAIRCFLRQDYSDSELVIVDDGTDAIADRLPHDSRVRYVRLDRKRSIGAKRNIACSHARGGLILHWDDDDWYPPSRVSTQVSSLIDRQADVCGSSRIYFFDAARSLAFEYRYTSPGAAWVAGSTLAYRRSFWGQHPFADIQVGEDSKFVWDTPGIRILDLDDPGLCAATIHAGNTSPKQTAGAYWRELQFERVREIVGDDLNFYRLAHEPPLVSCIMPTRDRRQLVSLALRLFVEQDYQNKELVIVDDGRDAVGDLVLNTPGVRYIRLDSPAAIGTKRNIACQESRGAIIAQWDDDDWYSSDRLRYQVAPILAGEADVTGLENSFVLEPSSGQFWRTSPQLHQRMFVGNVHGGTLVFTRELLAQGLRYPEVNLAEDAGLLQSALSRGKRLVRLSNPGVFIYMRHGSNAWREFAPGRFLNCGGWVRIESPLSLPAGVLSSYFEAVSRR